MQLNELMLVGFSFSQNFFDNQLQFDNEFGTVVGCLRHRNLVQLSINMPNSWFGEIRTFIFDPGGVMRKFGYMYLGFSASIEGSTEMRFIESWRFQTQGFRPIRPRIHPHNVPASDNKHHRRFGLGLGIAWPAFFSVVLVVFGWITFKKWNGLKTEKSFAAELVTGPREFSYNELMLATKGFHSTRVLGHGSFGTVYKAIFTNTGSIFAVTRSTHSHEGVDDMDMFKGISLKFHAMGMLLDAHPDCRGNVVLIQIMNPARSRGNEIQDVHHEIDLVAEEINEKFENADYKPIVCINSPVSTKDKVACYAVYGCVVVNAVRDGMNLVPYTYTVSRQGSPSMDKALGQDGLDVPRNSVIIVSEFIGCSPSLSSAIRVNPWDIESLVDGLNLALTVTDGEKVMKHYKSVASHDVASWARSFIQDLERCCKSHSCRRCWGIGFGLHFWDGVDKSPDDAVVSFINALSSDLKHAVFIVSGRGKEIQRTPPGSCPYIDKDFHFQLNKRWVADILTKPSDQASLNYLLRKYPIMNIYSPHVDDMA